MQPTVANDVGRFLRTIVIALHHVVAFHAHFAILGNAHLDVGHRLAGITNLHIPWARKGYHRSSFGHAVTFQHGETQRLKYRTDVGRQSGAATHQIVDVAAEFFVNFAKQHTRKAFRTDGFGHAEQRARYKRAADYVHDAFRQQFVQTRHADDNVYFAFVQRFNDAFGIQSLGNVNRFAHIERRHQRTQQGKNVVQRQQNHRVTLRRENLDRLRHRIDVEHHIFVRQHHALGRTRCARCVDDEHRLRHIVERNLLDSLGRHARHINVVFGQYGACGAGHAQRLIDHSPLSRCRENQIRFAIAYNVSQFAGCRLHIDRHGDDAHAHTAIKGKNPFGRIVGKNDGHTRLPDGFGKLPRIARRILQQLIIRKLPAAVYHCRFIFFTDQNHNSCVLISLRCDT